MPLFVVASPDDTVVPARTNAELLFPRAEPGVSAYIRVTGPHLGSNRFTPQMVARLVEFFQKLEQRAKARQRPDIPAIPLVMPSNADWDQRVRRLLRRSA